MASADRLNKISSNSGQNHLVASDGVPANVPPHQPSSASKTPGGLIKKAVVLKWVKKHASPEEREFLDRKREDCSNIATPLSVGASFGVPGLYYLAAKRKYVRERPTPFYVIMSFGVMTISAIISVSICSTKVVYPEAEKIYRTHHQPTGVNYQRFSTEN